MKKKQPRKSNVEGFVNRRRMGTIGDFKSSVPIKDAPDRKETAGLNNRRTGFTEEGGSDYDILRENEETTVNEVSSRRLRRGQKKPTKNPIKRWWRWRKARRERLKAKRANESRRRKILRRFFKILLWGLIIAAAYFFLKTYLTINSIIERDPNEGAIAVCEEPSADDVLTEGDSRVNILLVGHGGPNHDGGDLADSIIIVSLDAVNNQVSLLSIPRDMYVEIPGFGQDRINASHAYGEQRRKGQGVKVLEQTLEQTLDTRIHYYVRLDFKGFIQAVDAVGGVSLRVTNPVINDYNFSWMTEGRPLNVPKGQRELDGLTALLYARSRYTSPRGDFDRNDRQRQILIALKNEVLSAGTYSDPRKVNELLSVAGSHVRTNIGLDEMRCLYDSASEISDSSIISKGLNAENYLMGTSVNGASVQVPKTGNYNSIKNFVRRLFADGFITREAAPIDIFNGTRQAGAANDLSNKLKSYGYNIGEVANAPTRDIIGITIYEQDGEDKPYTKRYLEKRFDVEVTDGDLPEGITSTAKFVIILGSQ